MKLMHSTFMRSSEASGLKVNSDKSSIYLVVMQMQKKKKKKIDVGNLSFTYLGVPFNSRNLNITQLESPAGQQSYYPVHDYIMWRPNLLGSDLSHT